MFPSLPRALQTEALVGLLHQFKLLFFLTDERRLRKLKVYLRSVSYNSCEGLPKFPTLPDLYEDTILSEEFPCDSMKLSSRHHCAPTPFLIACCFNRRYPVNARKRAGYKDCMNFR